MSGRKKARGMESELESGIRGEKEHKVGREDERNIYHSGRNG